MKYETLGLTLDMGFDFDHYDPAKLPPLSQEDDQKWYSKFYYAGCKPASPEGASLFTPGRYMDPDKALLPGQFDRLMEPGHLEGDAGYCLLPNGVGYGSACTRLEGIPFSMFQWYKKQKVQGALVYQIWYPGSHVSEFNHTPVEDIGFGVEAIRPHSSIDRTQLGMSCDPAVRDPDFEKIMGGNGMIFSTDPAKPTTPRTMSLFHYVRALPGGGCEFRTHFYVGMHIENGACVVKQLIEPTLCLEITRRMLSHCIHERENLAAFLPEFYAVEMSRDKNEESGGGG